jgi:hypothetical protein
MKKKISTIAVMAAVIFSCWSTGAWGDDNFKRLKQDIEKEFFQTIDEQQEKGVRFKPVIFSFDIIAGMGVEVTFFTINSSGRVEVFKCLVTNTSKIEETIKKALDFCTSGSRA